MRPTLLLILLALACGDRDSKPEPKAPPASTPSEPATASDADVAFLVTACTDSGLPADQCGCAAERAKTALGADLLAKMKAAPPDDDPAIADYYNGSEVQRVMAWVESSNESCGFEEVN